VLSSLTKGVVCHMKERPGFSTEKYFCNSKHNWIKSQVISYNLLAAATRMAKVPDRVGSPLGYWSVRTMGGFHRPLRWIRRALELVPHGGAKCT